MASYEADDSPTYKLFGDYQVPLLNVSRMQRHFIFFNLISFFIV